MVSEPYVLYSIINRITFYKIMKVDIKSLAASDSQKMLSNQVNFNTLTSSLPRLEEPETRHLVSFRELSEIDIGVIHQTFGQLTLPMPV